MKKYIVSILVVCLFMACENEIPYRGKFTTPRLTMYVFINADSLTNMVYLNYTGKSFPGHVKDATVTIYVNSELKETAEVVPAQHHFDEQSRFLIKSQFKPGDVVRLEARTNDDKHHVWAEETVPYPIEVTGIDTVDVPLTESDNRRMLKKLRVRVTFKDVPKEKNYYRLALDKHITVKGKNYFGNDTTITYIENDYWRWDDLVLTEGRPVSTKELENDLFARIENRYGVFDDNMFADGEYTTNVQSWFNRYLYRYHDLEPETMDIHLAVRVISINETEYYYLKTLNYLESDVYDEYLSEPARIPTNVTNGVGVLGISSETGKYIHVIKDHKIDR